MKNYEQSFIQRGTHTSAMISKFAFAFAFTYTALKQEDEEEEEREEKEEFEEDMRGKCKHCESIQRSICTISRIPG